MNASALKRKLIALPIAALFVLVAIGSVMGQESYSDPQGRFSLAVPQGWVNENAEQFGLFSNGDTSLHVITVNADDMQPGIEAALTTAGFDASIPSVQTGEITETNGTWTQNVYTPADGSVYAVVARAEADTVYALIFSAPTIPAFQSDAASDMRPIVQSFTLAGQENVFAELADLSGQQPQAFDAALIAELEAYVNAALPQMGGSAAQIAIVQNGAIVYSGSYGTTAVDSDTSVTSETRFMVGSVTKPISGTMVATLVDEGLLTWDTPVVDLIPDFALAEADITSQITVRHLISHTSGIVLNRGWQSLLMYSPTELLDIVQQTPLEFHPGEGALYNDTGFTVGVYGAVAAAGHPYDDTIFTAYSDLMQSQLFTPLGMTRTTLDLDTTISDGDHVMPHTLDYLTSELVSQTLEIERVVYPTAPASAIWSTATDLARYLQMQLGHGTTSDGTLVVSEANLLETWTPQVDNGYGLDWFVGDNFGQPMIYHNGITPGFTAAISFLPEAQLGVVVLTNRNYPDNFNHAITQHVYELAFGFEHRGNAEAALAEDQYRAHAAETWASVTPVDADLAAAYTGTYTNSIQVQFADGELSLTTDYGDLQLLALPDEGMFLAGGALGNFGIAGHFAANDDGIMTLTLTSGIYGLPVTLTRVE